ncbi:hypothetical protein ACJIZ3_010471 [Penstemon smallii]|uniref:Hydroxyproline-rich glycoprotein family protein n=1 Tax=Penstemon smallii TaxID=265156 RepID=A0ABD3TH23_9LAMI
MRAHIFQTITIPSESLLNELRIVEEMKKRCDGKRELYEDLIKKQKEKGRLKGSKNESLPLHQLQEAHDEYDEEANVFVFRMKSLKQGQSRSLLTQASRHHAAQKALRSLEAVEPHVRLVAEQQHIDYQFSGLKDDGVGIYEYDDDDDGESDSGGDSDTEDGSETHDDGELSFDNGQIGPVQESSAFKSSMELDNMDVTFYPDPKLGAAKEILPSPGRNSFSFRREIRAISKSAPLFPEKKLDSTQMRPSPSRKFTSYVLPTPDETKSPVRKSDNEAPQTRQAAGNLWHSSPLDLNKYEKLQANEKFSGPIILDSKSVLKESNNNTKPTQLPPPLSQGLSFKQYDPSVASHAKKVKRQAFSGPLTGKPWPNNPGFSASGPIVSSGYPPPFSGSLLRTPLPRPTSAPKLSARLSPTYVSSPKISELHELPRPPPHLASRRPSNRSTHSGPLMSKSNEMTAARVSASTVASTLPTPPQVLPRSFSIPAGGPIEVSLRVPLEGSSKMGDDTSSPPLTPISLQNIRPTSPTS